MTGTLVRWLAARGYIDVGAADHASERAREASSDLPNADRLGMLLHDVADQAPPDIDPDELPDEDWVEDYLAITKIARARSGSRAASDPSRCPARPAISPDRDGRHR